MEPPRGIAREEDSPWVNFQDVVVVYNKIKAYNYIVYKLLYLNEQ